MSRKTAPLVGASKAVCKQPQQIYFQADAEQSYHQFGDKSNSVCRICKQDGELIIPCFCGSPNKYTHEECLLKWIARSVYQNHAKGQDYTNVRCESCNQVFKYKYRAIKRFSCDILCRSLKERGCPCVFWPIIVFLIALSVLIPASFFSMTENTGSIFYIKDKTGQYVLLSSTLLTFVIMLALVIVFFEQNLKYLELVIQKVYNFFDEERQVSNISKSSSSDENQVHPSRYFIVTIKNQPAYP